ncbi:hypothetical protein AAC387_Pa07g2163 [Persea americana]
MVFFSFSFDGEVINITFDRLVLHILKYLHHSPLICCTGIFQTKWHDSVAIQAKWGPKGCMPFIFGMHLYLVVVREAIDESHSCKPACVINHYLWYGEREFIFGASIIQVSIVNTDSDLPIFLCHGDDVGQPFGMLFLADEANVFEFLNFLFNFVHHIRTESSLALFDSLDIFLQVELVNCYFGI